LLLHGDRDTDVPYQQSVQMGNELSRRGAKHGLLTMPGRGHGFDGEMDDLLVAAAFARVLDFLDEYVKGSLK
jgi:dipeptidyl aminopeptidase/acylaminoacyl peptidase